MPAKHLPGNYCCARRARNTAIRWTWRCARSWPAPGAALTPGPLRGYIDHIEAPLLIEGWAQDVDYPELPVLLEAVLDDSKRCAAALLAARPDQWGFGGAHSQGMSSSRRFSGQPFTSLVSTSWI
jgi:hypothetical protein